MTGTKRRYVAVDLGAGSGRVIEGILNDGMLKMRELHRFDNPIHEEAGGSYWNINGLYENILQGLQKSQGEGASPVSFGIDSWGVDFGLLSAKGELLAMPRSYRDPRTEGMTDSFFRRCPREEVYRRTGIQFLPFNSIYQLESMRQSGDKTLDSVRDLLFIPDLLGFMLTGKKATEFSIATTSQLFNPETHDWDDLLIEKLDIDPSIFQVVIEPGDFIGMIKDDIAEKRNLSRMKQVAVASHDTASAVAAVPAKGKNWAYISCGTWSLMGIESEKPIINDAAMEMNFTNEGGICSSYRILKNLSGMWPLQQCIRRWNKEGEDCTFERLLHLASLSKPFKTLIDFDHIDFVNPADMLQAINRYALHSAQPRPEGVGDYVRAILESLALKYRLALEQLEMLFGRHIEIVHIIGGGSKNEMLCRFACNAMNRQVVAGPVEATAMGNLLVQAMADDRINSHEELRSVSAASVKLQRYLPEETSKYRKALSSFVGIMDEYGG